MLGGGQDTDLILHEMAALHGLDSSFHADQFMPLPTYQAMSPLFMMKERPRKRYFFTSLTCLDFFFSDLAH